MTTAMELVEELQMDMDSNRFYWISRREGVIESQIRNGGGGRRMEKRLSCDFEDYYHYMISNTGNVVRFPSVYRWGYPPRNAKCLYCGYQKRRN